MALPDGNIIKNDNKIKAETQMAQDGKAWPSSVKKQKFV